MCAVDLFWLFLRQLCPSCVVAATAQCLFVRHACAYVRCKCLLLFLSFCGGVTVAFGTPSEERSTSTPSGISRKGGVFTKRAVPKHGKRGRVQGTGGRTTRRSLRDLRASVSNNSIGAATEALAELQFTPYDLQVAHDTFLSRQ